MILLSRIMIQNPQLESFEELMATIVRYADEGETLFEPDIKPPYTDTPRNWQDVLEAAFVWGDR